MTKPARPKVLPTESSIPLPTSNEPLTHQQELNHLSRAIDHLLRLDTASQQALTRALHENCVRDECLAIAKTALGHYDRLGLAIPKKALAQINERLAELEPEEETT